MSAYERALKKKRAEAIQNMTEEEIKIYDLTYRLQKEFDDMVSRLHQALFPEEYDFLLDDGVDADMRRHGKSPMSEEYTKAVNARRVKMGFLPLGEDGNPVDGEATRQYCADRIASRDLLLK